ncbi:MAG: hypothetical protein H6667_24195 [Ardenticatenaceae bacterium]|nr:hypothetical protein [Ardenticatenaceae bacterium]
MSNFNWQTDDDVNWDDRGSAAETAVPRRHPWITYALIVVGVITAVALIYRQVNQRIETATANATGDILASHNLVQQASADRDVELFNTLLSGIDDAWVEAQSELVQYNGLFDRSAFDLTRLSVDTAVTQADVDSGAVTIELNPELSAAEMAFLQDYAVNVGNGVTETVKLRQTAVYRLGSQRWLYAPPTAEFWGGFETTSGGALRLVYPARDAELALRLAFDLEAKLAEMCRSLVDLNCPDGFSLNVRMENDPQLLIDFARPVFALDERGQLNLPTPTLVGLPLDETGYQALFRGYAIQLVGAAVAQLTGYECCDHLAYFQALLDYQLDALGLRPLNLNRADYERVIRENIAFEDLDDGWRSPVNLLNREDNWLVVTAVDFIHQQLPNNSIAGLQQKISRNLLFTNWLGAISAESTEFNRYSLGSRWRSYALEQYLVRQKPPPLPLPTQDIYLLCSSDQEAEQAQLYQYRLANSELIPHALDGLTLSLSPLPDDEALLLLQADDDEVLHTYLWQDGRRQILPADQTITFGQFDPTGQYLQVYGLNELVINRVDWPACTAGDCQLEPLGGYPVWSPQGTDFLMLPTDSLGYEPFVMNGRTILFDPTFTPDEWPIYRGNSQPPATSLDALTYVGMGYAPFWLDESTFGFIRQIPLSADGNRQELVLMSITDETPQPILLPSQLQLALPEDSSFTVPFIHYVIPHLQQPNLIFVVATGNDRKVYIFSYNVNTDELRFLLETGLGESHSLGFSPDGRFLVVTGTEDGQQLFYETRNDLFLYDLDTDQVKMFAGTRPGGFTPANTYDWSADGRWLIIVQENQTMTLAAPAYDYEQFIPNSLGNCTNVVWLNE